MWALAWLVDTAAAAVVMDTVADTEVTGVDIAVTGVDIAVTGVDTVATADTEAKEEKVQL